MTYVNIQFSGSRKQYAYEYKDGLERLSKGTTVVMRTPFGESIGKVVNYLENVPYAGHVKKFHSNCLNFSELFPKKPKPKPDTSAWNDFDF